MLPTTPSPISQSVSAPTSRLRKRSSVGRPLSSLNRLSNGKWAEASTTETGVQEDFDWTSRSQHDTKQPSVREAVPFEFQGTGTAKSSWLRRMSTLSSLKSDSLVSTPPRPGSTMSMSNGSTANGSTAPILATFPNSSPAVAPRNKLVKRSASQRALQGDKQLHSTLRRPATSHQRSATLQQRQFYDEGSNYQPPFRQSLPFEDLQEDNPPSDSTQTWGPFFKSEPVQSAKDGSSLKRNANGVMNRNELPRSIVPGINQLPTLLSATSITPGSSDTTVDDDPHAPSQNRPTTPVGFDTLVSPSTEKTMPDANSDFDAMPRRSFSIAEMFPSPSPSTWKMPRAGSLRRSRGSSGALNSRRIISAPHSSKTGQTASIMQGESGFGTQTRIWSPGRDRDNSYETDLNPTRADARPSSSPLPPLDRSSTFDMHLPNTAPSYPTSPQPEKSASSPKLYSPPSPSVASPQGHVNTLNKSNRPSRVPSDRASTLLGSDNENSRFLSGDEDDGDGRSDTVYDSLRTGATGSSHSGVRRPPIETIFDESPPAGLSKAKLFAWQDLEPDNSFAESSPKRHRVAEEDPTSPTSARVAGPCKDENYPTPVHITNKTLHSPELPSSPPVSPLEIKLRKTLDRGMDDFQDDETWSLEEMDDSNGDFGDRTHESPSDNRSNRLPVSSKLGSTVLPLPNPDLTDGQEQLSKPNIFDWSEQPLVEKSSPQGSSPRPRTVHGKNSKESRGSRLTGRRGPSALHLRSQSVPVPPEASGHRSHNSTHKLESWILGNKGVSEDWDNDFEFDEPPRSNKQSSSSNDITRSASGMLVPPAIMERQASVHGQFGQVKELTLLVEELKRLQQQASAQGIMQGQSAELWKEAEGIINLATLDDEEQDLFPPRSPRSPSNEFDPFEEDSPAGHGRHRSDLPPPGEESLNGNDNASRSQTPSRSTPERSRYETPPTSRPRRESVAKAKSVLETIHQQRNHYNPALLDSKSPQKKLPFDTTSLRDLVTRAGVVTRALKEIVRRAENAPLSPKSPPSTPQDPPFSHMFQNPPSSPSVGSKIPRVTQSPKNGTFLGGTISGNDNEINGHMKMMAVV